MTKDIKKSVWRNAFNDLDENGDEIPQSKKIKSDSAINKGRANRHKAKDPDFLKKVQEGIQQRNNSSQYQEKMEKIYKDPNFQKKRLQRIKETSVDPEYQKKRKEGINRFQNDKERKKQWIDNVNASRHLTVEKTKKPIQTPNGIFPSLKEAAEFYGIKNTSLRDRMKHHPDKYYYIKK